MLDAYDYTAEFTLVGVTESNFLGYTGGHILGLAGEGTAAELLPEHYLYYILRADGPQRAVLPDPLGNSDFQNVVDHQARRQQDQGHNQHTRRWG